FLILPPPPISTLFPYTTLFRSRSVARHHIQVALRISGHAGSAFPHASGVSVGRGIVDHLLLQRRGVVSQYSRDTAPNRSGMKTRSEEHTSELQSRSDLVCRLLL